MAAVRGAASAVPEGRRAAPDLPSPPPPPSPLPPSPPPPDGRRSAWQASRDVPSLNPERDAEAQRSGCCVSSNVDDVARVGGRGCFRDCESAGDRCPNAAVASPFVVAGCLQGARFLANRGRRGACLTRGGPASPSAPKGELGRRRGGFSLSGALAGSLLNTSGGGYRNPRKAGLASRDRGVAWRAKRGSAVSSRSKAK